MLSLETKILLIEDSQIAAAHTVSILNAIGFKYIIEARNGFTGIHRLVEAREAKSEFGLFIVDWEMPRLSGLDFFNMVKGVSSWSSIPVIFLTSNNSLEHVLKAVAAGVEYYLVKPPTKEAIEKKLDLISEQIKSRSLIVS